MLRSQALLEEKRKATAATAVSTKQKCAEAQKGCDDARALLLEWKTRHEQVGSTTHVASVNHYSLFSVFLRSFL
jgi:hypothetical protein